MKKREFIQKLEEILGLSEGSLSSDLRLEQIEAWDSLAVLSYISIVDEMCGITLNAGKVSSAETVGDLLNLVRDKLED